MKRRSAVLAAVIVSLVLPLLLALTDAVSYHMLNRSNGTLVSSGQEREYQLYVPGSYDPSRPTPLVISMHGAAGWPVQQMNMSRWNQLAEAEGVIVVYPSGAAGVGPRIWHVDGGAGLMRDVGFISALIDTLEAVYNIDPARIYANGLSNGGGMAFVLSCTLSDRIAAVGMVAAAYTLPWNWCSDSLPVPMIAFHGTADPVTPYDGGRTWVSNRQFPNIPAWTANWARRNRCHTTPIASAVALDATRLEYPHCADAATVVLYTVRGGGHQWPGGEQLPEWLVGPAISGVDATSEMWAFFREQRLY